MKELNLPKQLLDKSEAILKTLFGETFKEFGGMIADQVRLRRFKNQLDIFEKAEKILIEKKISPKKVSLKVLVPLLDLSSLEEENTLQDMWANLTVNILEVSDDEAFQQQATNILSKISTSQAKLLDRIFTEVYDKRKDAFDKGWENKTAAASMEEYSLADFPIKFLTVYDTAELAWVILEYQISNLITLGILKWETKVTFEPTEETKNQEEKEFDLKANSNDYFTLTPLGFKFMCVSKGVSSWGW